MESSVIPGETASASTMRVSLGTPKDGPKAFSDNSKVADANPGLIGLAESVGVSVEVSQVGLVPAVVSSASPQDPESVSRVIRLAPDTTAGLAREAYEFDI